MGAMQLPSKIGDNFLYISMVFKAYLVKGLYSAKDKDLSYLI
jgi:hypothetical protein